MYKKYKSNKDEQLTCEFLEVVGNGAALLVMPDIELLNILDITCNTVAVPQSCKEINAQKAEGKCCTKKSSTPNPMGQLIAKITLQIISLQVQAKKVTKNKC